MWRGVAWAGAVLVLTACSAEIPEARFRCVGHIDCPTDWYCVAGHCQSTPGDAAAIADSGPRDDAPTIDAPTIDAPTNDGPRPCTGPSDCNDGNDCTIDLCMSDTCTYAFDDDGSSCDDDVFCNGADTCASGVCGHAGDPCDAMGRPCDEMNDWCMCDDGNGCTGDDHIAPTGGCVGDPAVAHHSLCGPCDASGCRMCCNGSCQNTNQREYCAGCDSPCSGTESCVYNAARPCAWLWCCAA